MRWTKFSSVPMAHLEPAGEDLTIWIIFSSWTLHLNSDTYRFTELMDCIEALLKHPGAANHLEINIIDSSLEK